MATRTTTPKTKAATKSTGRATTKRAPAKRAASAKTAPRKTTARKTPTRSKAAAARTVTASTALATLRRNAFPLAGALAAGAATAAALYFTRRSNVLAEGHPAPDLETGAHPGPDDRADPHMDAPMTANDRAALAPALANGDARTGLRH